MKTALSIALSALSASALTLAGHSWWSARSRAPQHAALSPAPQVSSAASAAPARAATPASSAAAPLTEQASPASALDAALETRVLALEEQLAALLEQGAWLNEPGAARDTGAALVLGEAPSAAARELVQGALAEERAAQAQQRARDAQAWAEQRAEARADALALELGLAGADRDALAGLLKDEHARLRELRAQLGFEPGELQSPQQALEQREALRAGLDEIRAWKSVELASRLGSEAAQAVQALEGRRGRGRGNRAR
jgi:hypothetical protein